MEFKKEKTIEEVWEATEWGTFGRITGVRIKCKHSSAWGILNHEKQIEDPRFSEAPKDLKTYVRSEILAHRPEGENEVRGGRALYQLRWHEGRKQIRYINRNEEWFDHTSFILFAQQARAEAWFERNKPAPEWQEVAGAPGYAVRKRSDQKCLVRDPNTDDWEIWKRVVLDGSSDLFSHPEPVITAVCRLFEINRADVLREDETMNECGHVLKMKVEGDRLRLALDDCGSAWWERPWLESHEHIAWVPRALAYLNKHAPKLAGNQVRANTIKLRWTQEVTIANAHRHIGKVVEVLHHGRMKGLKVKAALRCSAFEGYYLEIHTGDIPTLKGKFPCPDYSVWAEA